MANQLFLTPPDIPEGLTCRTLKMPSSLEWLGIFNSALDALTEEWRWQQVHETDLTPAETIEVIREILAQYWSTSECDMCVQPSGLPFVRINGDGHFEQYDGTEWIEPQGSLELPPITPREGEPPDDLRCLAAANAANVLKQLYEEVSDAFIEGKTTAEAITDLILLIAAIIAAPLSLLVAAILAVAEIVFKVFYDTVAFVSADYWTTDFNTVIQCSLYECSSIDGEGVVTFDFECFNIQLAQKINVEESPFNVLLFGQVQYLLMWIGADGLNLAGATTAITSAECECGWRYVWNFLETDGDFVYDPDQSPYGAGTWVPGLGWRADNTGLTNGCGTIYASGVKSQPFDIPADCTITRFFAAANDGDLCSHMEMFVGVNRAAGIAPGRLQIYQHASSAVTALGAITGTETGVHVGIECTYNVYPFYYGQIQIWGTGTPPDFVGGTFF